AGDRLTATVSLGVSRGAKSPQEAEAWARKALDMALGRGGDQVAVMQGEDTYEFFGGLSKGVEKRDKVRTRVFAATLSDDMKESDTVLVMGHRYSDLDCIGAAAGIWSVACKSLGRPAYIVVDREHTLAGPLIDRLQKSCPDEQIFLSPSEALSLVTPKTMLVVVDTHSPDFVESTDLLSAVARVVVIDHHRMMVRHIENALVFYHEPFASSASEMVAELVQYLGDRAVTPAVAEAMLAGVMLDTKYFVLKTGVRTFEAAAYLRRKGADTVTVKRMFSDSIDAYKAKYRIVSNARMYGRFAVASTDAELPDIRVSAAQAADELLSIQGVDASFVIYPAGGVVNVSARSLGEVNVQLIMEALGGGGHLTMAGAQLSGVTVDQAREKLVAVIQAQKDKPHKS
ncbi:MAG TPA: DHH family phosphoesterase, partial [Ruminococcaceae bacterium]|nr:DHH family phosphoesterase [Oscillospiraceae bacterium]